MSFMSPSRSDTRALKLTRSPSSGTVVYSKVVVQSALCNRVYITLLINTLPCSIYNSEVAELSVSTNHKLIYRTENDNNQNKKVQLSLTNPRDAV